MKYLIVSMMCLLASSKVTIQSFFGKAYVKNTADALLFNGAVFCVAALLFCRNIPGCSEMCLLYGAMFGLLTVIFQLAYTKALVTGNVSLTVMVVNLSMIVPVIISVAVYKEDISVYRVIGAVLTCLSFVFGVNMHNHNLNKWFIPAICAFLANGGLSVVQKVFGKSGYSDEKTTFVSVSYIIAAIITFIIYFIVQSKEGRTFSMN